jgi:segregation and condensation protein B
LENLQQHIEALLFASEQSITINDIKIILSTFSSEEISEESILESIVQIQEKYSADEFVFEVVEMSNGYQFLSKKTYYDLLNMLIIHKEKKKLSTAAMETLAIIAYKQPITKSEIELIRGVNCDYSVQKLLEKDLIAISGRSSGPGKPILYETSESFMDHFGLKTPRDLPQLKDLHTFENTINPEESMVGAAEPISNAELAELENVEPNAADEALDAMIAEEFEAETNVDENSLDDTEIEEVLLEEANEDADGIDEDDLNSDNNEDDELSEK